MYFAPRRLDSSYPETAQKHLNPLDRWHREKSCWPWRVRQMMRPWMHPNEMAWSSTNLTSRLVWKPTDSTPTKHWQGTKNRNRKYQAGSLPAQTRTVQSAARKKKEQLPAPPADFSSRGDTADCGDADETGAGAAGATSPAIAEPDGNATKASADAATAATTLNATPRTPITTPPTTPEKDHVPPGNHTHATTVPQHGATRARAQTRHCLQV